MAKSLNHQNIFSANFFLTLEMLKHRFCSSFSLTKMLKHLVLFTLGLGIFYLTSLQLAANSAPISNATIQEILDGRQVYIQNIPAAVNDVAQQSQQVRTGNSRTALMFNSGAIARLSANSILTIGQCANLRSGSILINGAVNACSAGITAGVRGTTYLLEIDENGSQRVQVLEGEVVVKRNQITPENSVINNNSNAVAKPEKATAITKPKIPLSRSGVNNSRNIPLKNPAKPMPSQLTGDGYLNPAISDKPLIAPEKTAVPAQSEEVYLKSGEKVEVDRKGELGIVQQLTEAEFTNLLRGNLFQGFSVEIPGLAGVQAEFSRLFPGARFPISVPSINIPGIPGFRLPF
jgi:hypothetical protein